MTYDMAASYRWIFDPSRRCGGVCNLATEGKIMTRDPEPRRCIVCDKLNPEGVACKGVWCPRAVRKERIRKDQFEPSNPEHFRLQSRGGAWRYYVRVG